MEQLLARKVLTYRWAIFWIMAAAYVLVSFHRLCPAVVALDLQKSLDVSGGAVGILASAYFYPYALMQFPAGLLSDSLGPRKTVTLFLVVAGIGSMLLGLAQGIVSAVAARILVGLGVSMVFIPTMKIFSQWFRVTEFSFMSALMAAMGGVGALISATPLAWMTGWFGWRASFGMVGAFTLAIAVLVWMFVRNRPGDKGWPSLAEIDHKGPGKVLPPDEIPLWEGAKRVVREKYFWPLAVWFFCLMWVFFGFAGMWAGPYFMNTYGMTRGQAAAVLNMTAVGLIIGAPLVSYLSDRVLFSRKSVMVVCSVILTALVLFLNIFPDGLPVVALYAVMLLLTISGSAVVVIGFTSTKELFPVEMAGTSVGTVNLFPFLGGAVSQPVLGRLLDAYPKTATGAYSLEGYKAMLLVMLGAAVAGLVCTFFMKETFPLHWGKETTS